MTVNFHIPQHALNKVKKKFKRFLIMEISPWINFAVTFVFDS